MQAQFTLPDGERRSLTGFMTVDRDKLKTLEGDMLSTLMSTDELECIFLHLASLRHFGQVADRAANDGGGKLTFQSSNSGGEKADAEAETGKEDA